MPPGRIHYKIYIDKGWVIIPPLLLVAILFFIFPSLWWVYLWFGILLGYMPLGMLIDPDMDQLTITKAEGRILALDNRPSFQAKKYRERLQSKTKRTFWEHLLNAIALVFWRSVTLVIQLFIWIWISAWFGYAILIPHRNILSHGFIVSTPLRVLYFWFVVGILTARFGMPEQFSAWMELLLHPFGIGITIGLGLADSLHILADYGRIDLTNYQT